MSDTKFNIRQAVKATLSKWFAKNPSTQFRPHGVFHVQHIRDGKVINEFDAPNGVTNEGLNSNLGVYFNSVTQITAWYAGLINDPATLAAADVMNAHAGWTENVGYTEANRVTFVFDAAASQSIANGTTSADFNINAVGTLHGIFVVSNNTKSGTTGTLWATAPFASPLSVTGGDLLKITYTVSAS